MAIKVQGRRLAEGDLGTTRPLPRRALPSAAEFRFGIQPNRWCFYSDTGEFLPHVSHVRLEPGVNGVRALRAGADGRTRVDDSILVGAWRAKGGQLIDPNDPRLGEFCHYVQAIENDGGGLHHCSIFESFEAVGTRVFASSNQADFRRFQRHLIACGMVPPIHPQVKRLMVDAQTKAIDSLRQRFGSNPAHAGLRDELRHEEAVLRAMVEERPVADVLGGVEPLPGAAPIEEEEADAGAGDATPSRRGRKPGEATT